MFEVASCGKDMLYGLVPRAAPYPYALWTHHSSWKKKQTRNGFCLPPFCSPELMSWWEVTERVREVSCKSPHSARLSSAELWLWVLTLASVWEVNSSS